MNKPQVHPGLLLTFKTFGLMALNKILNGFGTPLRNTERDFQPQGLIKKDLNILEQLHRQPVITLLS